MSRALAFAVAAGWMAAPCSGGAQDVGGARELAARVPSVQAVRRRGAIRLDGRLDEAEWAQAPPATGFRQQDPDEGLPARERTEVRFLYDDDALYVGARMMDTHGGAGVHTRLARRDEQPGGDYVMLVLDTYHDHVGRTVLRVNPSGVQYDALATGRANPDPAWDAIWECVTRIDSLGWTAEIRIPFAQLRLATAGPQTWGLQIWRYEEARNETSQWAYWTKREPGGPTYFGHLTGIAPALHAISAEAFPYVAVGVAPRAPDAGGAASHAARASHTAGADVRLHAPGGTATLTLNPDFGQVEVDPAVVNLTASETFFPEKRPFFVQDAGVFGFGAMDCGLCEHATALRLYYSRRIGRPPSLHPAGTVTDAPATTPILGAARLAVQTRNGWTVGALAARTDRDVAAVLDTLGRTRTIGTEPATSYLVGRAERRDASGDGSVGVIGSLTDRSLTDRALRSLLPARAATGGVDAERAWSHHTYRASVTIAASSVAGDSLAMQRVQTSSVHYFQRPDAGAVMRYDPGLRRLDGYAAAARVAREGGAWTWEALSEIVSPGFEANDLGFVPLAGIQWTALNVRRGFTTPRSWYHEAAIIGGAELQRNFDGDVTARTQHVLATLVTPSYWTMSVAAFRHAPHRDDRLLRGGPAVGVAGGDSVSVTAGSDTRRAVSASIMGWRSATGDGDHTAGIAPSVAVRPSDGVSLSVGVRAERVDIGSQLIATTADTLAPFGRRYTVAALRQRTAALELRAAAALTRTLTLDAYVQPFATAGSYRDEGALARMSTASRLVYGRDVGTVIRARHDDGSTWLTIDPDGAGPADAFTTRDPTGVTRSLRGTAVLRWEYRPGATVYLAWTQTRTGLAADGALDLARDGAALVAARPLNALVLKATYRIAR